MNNRLDAGQHFKNADGTITKIVSLHSFGPEIVSVDYIVTEDGPCPKLLDMGTYTKAGYLAARERAAAGV